MKGTIMIKKLIAALAAAGFFCACTTTVLANRNSCVTNTNCGNYFYFDMGTSAYRFDYPTFSVGTLSTSSTTALNQIDTKSVTPMYQLKVGHRFPTHNQSFFSYLFGEEGAIEFELDHARMDKTHNTNYSGQGQLWDIRGNVPIYQLADSTDIYGTQFNASHVLTSPALYLKGFRQTSIPQLTITPYIGVIYTYLHDIYDSNIKYDTDPTEVKNIKTDHEAFDLATNNYGLSLGERFNYLIFSHLSLFTDINLQLLSQRTALSVTQNPVDPEVPYTGIYTVNDNKKTLSYRGTFIVGSNYNFSNKPDSISLGLQGGLDRWGYMPKVVTPNHAGDRAVHIDGEAANNLFAGLELHVPIH
jgi:hypothetical protein